MRRSRIRTGVRPCKPVPQIHTRHCRHELHCRNNRSMPFLVKADSVHDDKRIFINGVGRALGMCATFPHGNTAILPAGHHE